MAFAKLADFSRIILLRSASDFDRLNSGQEAVNNLLTASEDVSPLFKPFILAG